MFSSPLQKMMTAILLAATVIGCGKGGSDDTSSTATDTGPTVDSDYDGWYDLKIVIQTTHTRTLEQTTFHMTAKTTIAAAK